MTIELQSSFFINGEFIAGKGDFMPVINPATETLIGNAALATAEETEYAITSAKEAFDHGIWPRMSIPERVAILEKFHAALVARKAQIVELIVAEAGATNMLAELMHFDLSMKLAKGLLADALLITPEMTPVEVTPAMDGSKVLGTSTITYEPVGVVAAITPYNFPFFLNIVKLFHALTMGNTVILKPSPLTPYEAMILSDVAVEVGIPKGVLNIINGDIHTGELLTSDRRIDMVTFTGSDKVGAAIITQAASSLTKTHMELGGKSALVVRADADLQAAAMAGLASFTIQCGQGCALTTRHLVHNSVRGQYVQMLQQMVQHVNVGNPTDPAVNMGPLIRNEARERVESHIALGLESGANLMAGGKRPGHLDKGFFFEPTFFDNVDSHSVLAQEEVFGPVAAIIGFDTDEEAIDIANNSNFGLSGNVFSKDVGAAYEMALQMRTGGVMINEGAGTLLSSAPFGGYKRSGYGREFGRHGLLEYCEIKAISFRAG